MGRDGERSKKGIEDLKRLSRVKLSQVAYCV